MYTCPVCHQPGISTYDKLRSGPWVPATCRKCGAKSYTHPMSGYVLSVVLFFGILYASYLALIERSWLPLVVFALIWVALQIAIVKFAPLVPKRTK